MSRTLEAAVPAEKNTNAPPWSLWARQTLALLRLELGKSLLSRRALLLYLLAALPLMLLALLVVFPPDGEEFKVFPRMHQFFSVLFNGLILGTIVFFGCAWVFMNLFRGEIVDRSLHYYFLSPVRREVLVVGKYLSGLATAILLFGGTTLLSLLLFYFPHFPAESTRFFFEGAGLGRALTYLGIVVLACVGYGAMFLLIGLFFRNPVIPALLLYGWEWLNFLLPPLLKKLSVIHYLHSLDPVPIPDSPFAVLAQPTPAWLSVPGLVIFTLLVLALAGLHIRRMEINYLGD